MTGEFMMGVGASFGIGLALAIFYFSASPEYHKRRFAREAAGKLKAEIRTVREALDAYHVVVKQFVDGYGTENPDLSPQIPVLRLLLDKIKTSPTYMENCGRIRDRADEIRIFPNYKVLHDNAYMSMIMLHSLVSLLKCSKTSGFMRSTKMLEEYITHKSQTGLKKVIIANFADDLVEESVYNVVSSLANESKVFESCKPLFDDLEISLDKIIKRNGILLFTPW
ncbi:hypothetical protein Q1W73_05390 [Asticcacaulis sp. ZE23SCel15]|uniref:hypothetical protein n=1 Tax=Asticcacaulis sp. ZE23SCel15 TaxID=3059027 RepID=UPI00265D781D|nr:hypothetical protein [Asticcacaulis sp. ZE23SCel15]WKL58420.1 hypothetical protein Q1W73_05390 [Asticcacaulis sp. ZE23SCel15]